MNKRISVRVRTRKLDRLVAHRQMKKAGIYKANSHAHGDSFFSLHWREVQ